MREAQPNSTIVGIFLKCATLGDLSAMSFILSIWKNVRITKNHKNLICFITSNGALSIDLKYDKDPLDLKI